MAKKKSQAQRMSERERENLETQSSNLKSAIEAMSAKMVTSDAPATEQIVAIAELAHKRAEVLRKLGAKEKEIKANYDAPSAAFAGRHYEFNQELREISSRKQDSDAKRLSELEVVERTLTPLSEAQRADLMKMGPYGEGIIATTEKDIRRRQAEVQATRRVISQQSRTRFRTEAEILTQPTRMTEDGRVETLGIEQRLGYLSEKEAELKQNLENADPIKKEIAKGQLQDLYGITHRLKVAGTREQAAGIIEATRLGPTETAPGIWQAPSLAASRTASQAALVSAQQMQAQLKADPSATPEQQKTANELLRKMVDQLSKIDSSIKQGQEALKTSVAQNPLTSMFMSRKEGEEDADYAQRIAQQGARNRALGASVLSAASTAVNTAAAIRGMTFDMPRRTIGLESSVEGARQSQILQSLSYSAENRARFGGNVLFGDRTLGAPGYELANRMSAAEMERRRSAESLQATGTGLSTAVGLGQMILGGATIAATGWTGIGGILGAGLMASGFGTMGTGLVSAAQNTRVQETGMLDAFGPFSSYAGATRQAQQMQARDALMNAALERNKVNIASQDAYQSQMDTWNQNIRSAGALAVSPMDVVGQSRSVSDTVAVQAGRDAVNAYVKSKDTAARASVRKDLANEAVGRDWSYGHMPGVDVWAPVDAADVKRAADLVSIKQKARTDSLNTQLTKNVQEQSMQLLDTTWAKYGISADEWSTKVSNVSSRLGVGAMGMSKRAREATTERILNMSMAGVGTFEQIAGNQEILSSITGRTDATKDVEKVLRNAVKAGFDDSRTGQAFMQNVVQLSSALGLRSTDQVSGRIGLGTRLLGGTEKDMEAMTRGMAQVPAMFEQSRVIGGLNFASFVAGGGLELKGSFAQTAFDISKNPERALKVREDVERLRKKGLKEGATASKINQLLESQEFKDIDPEVRGILLTEGVGGLDKFTQAATTGYRSLISMSGIDKEKEALLSKFRGKKTLTKQEKEELKMGMQGLRYRGRDMFMALGQSEEAATAATSYALTDLGDDRALVEQAFGSKGSFERQMKQGSGDSERAAAIRRYDVTQRAALAAQAAGKAKDPLTDEQLGDLAVGGKIQFMSGKGAQARQQEIDVTRAQQLIKPGAQAQGGVEKAFKEWATNNNQLQASLQQQMLTSLESVLSGKTQQVYVMNWEGMVVAQSTFKDLPAPGHK